MPSHGFNLANIEAFVGRELGVSGWVTMNHQCIDQFAECTENHPSDPPSRRQAPRAGDRSHAAD